MFAANDSCLPALAHADRIDHHATAHASSNIDLTPTWMTVLTVGTDQPNAFANFTGAELRCQVCFVACMCWLPCFTFSLALFVLFFPDSF